MPNNWKSFYNDIKSNLIKNAYSPFLIDKFIKKYLDYKFSSNQAQLKDKSGVHHFKGIFAISEVFPTISKINFRNLAKSFVKKIVTLSLFLVHSKLKITFHTKTRFLMI